MAQRISHVSGYSAVDPTPDCQFASMSVKFKPDKVQVLNVKDYCHPETFKTVQMDESSMQLTKVVRDNLDHLQYTLPLKRFFLTPMLMPEDGPAFLLPLDNSLGCDWLTYKDPRYKDFIYDLANRLVKQDPSVEESAKTLLVDYSANVPFASVIRHDGMLKLQPETWPHDARHYFAKSLQKALKNNFLTADIADCRPSINGPKSTGTDLRFPDGTPLVKSDFWILPEDPKYTPENSVFFGRKNFAPFKIEWLASGAVLENLKFFLDNMADYSKPSVYLKALEKGACSIHLEAYRTNNPDVPKIDFNGDFNKSRGKGFKKDRDCAYEIDGYKFESFVVDDEKYAAAVRKLDSRRSETFLKKRPMFPANNASFMLPFIFLFRLFLHPIEDGPKGFPSLNLAVLSRFQRWYSKSKGADEDRVITFDRRTCEQFISDNFSEVLSLFSGPLQCLIHSLCVVLLPSLKGPRVVDGGLASGSAITTFLNSIVGMFECSLLISTITGHPFEQCCDKVFECLFGDTDWVSFDDGKEVFISLGTDDQIILTRGFAVDDHQLEQYAQKRSLKIEAVKQAIVFGMRITTEDISYYCTGNLDKFPLIEKKFYGDQAAMNYDMRLSLLPDFYDTIAGCMKDHKFGNATTYKLGTIAFLRKLHDYGEAVAFDINQYSPKERLAADRFCMQNNGCSLDEFLQRGTDRSKVRLGPGFSKCKHWKDDYLKDSRYPIEFLEPIYSLFKAYLFT